MKVLYLTNLPAPYTVEFLSRLGDKCELTVVFEREAASDRDENWKSNITPHYREIVLKGLKVGAENSFCLDIRGVLQEHFDIVIIGMYSTFTAMMAIVYMKKRKIPFYISTDGGFISEENSLKRGLKRWLISRAEAWLSPSSNSDEYLSFYGADKNKIYRYPFTSLDDKDILTQVLLLSEKKELRNELGLPQDKRLYIGVGQFIHRKGWDVLIKAWSEAIACNTDMHLLIVGGSKERFLELMDEENVREDFEKVSSHISIIPFMDKESLWKYYRVSYVFILPTREDIWGLVVNEAMANGLTVITTSECNAGIELVNDGKNGYLYQCDDLTTLKNILVETNNMPTEELTEMGTNSLNRIKNYTYAQMAECVYNSLKQGR